VESGKKEGEKMEKTTEKKKFFTVYRMAVIGLMAALVFVCTFLHIDIATPMGKTMIHFGNIMSLLTGLLFGPLTGGLAAGIGSAIYDLMDPVFAPEFWITFIMKFAMGFVAGLIAHGAKAKGQNKARNIVAAVVAAVTYVALYGLKTVIMQRFVMGAVWEAVLPVLVTKVSVSSLNAVIASVCSILLCLALRRPLEAAGVFSKLEQE